jgi:ParB/RepB/Spo0J family partition protein
MPRADNPNKFYILDGTRRWNAVKYLRWSTVQCYIGPALEDEQALGLMLTMDSSREAFSPLERGISFRVLREQLQFSQRQLAKFLNLPQSEISRCETLRDSLSQPLVDAISTKTELRWISHNHLRQLIRLRDLPEKQEQVFTEMIQEKWSSRKLAIKIDEILHKRQKENCPHIELSNEAFTVIIQFKESSEGDKTLLFRHLGTLNFKIFEICHIDFKTQAEWYGSMADLAKILAMDNQSETPINSILKEMEQE